MSELNKGYRDGELFNYPYSMLPCNGFLHAVSVRVCGDNASLGLRPSDSPQAVTWHAVSVRMFMRPISKIRDMACNTTSGLRTQNLALRTQPNIQRGAKTWIVIMNEAIHIHASDADDHDRLIRKLARRAKPHIRSTLSI